LAILQGSPSVGGLIWLKNVADYIDQNASSSFSVLRISNDIAIDERNTIFPLHYAYDALKAFFRNPDIAILSFYGEANLPLWALLRIFKPHSKIFTVCHHYEEKKYHHKCIFFFGLLQLAYIRIIDKLTRAMIRNSDRILTDSVSSSNHLSSVFGAEIKKRVVVCGVGIDPPPVHLGEKNIDFLCIGRIDKFKGLENIWQLIRQERPDSSFVMSGHGPQREINKVRCLGIDHKGVISEKAKIELLSRSKVLLFPSYIEGFGIAVAEALSAGLKVVAWKVPVFDELYGEVNDLKQIEGW
jgi:glycosyltransferase involved in cell wall biosynthesis